MRRKNSSKTVKTDPVTPILPEVFSDVDSVSNFPPKKEGPSGMDGFNFRRLAILVVVLVIIMAGWFFIYGMSGKNDIQTYQIFQGITGNVDVIDTPGYYWRNFGTAWSYHKTLQKYWSEDKKEGRPEDESVQVTFNDNGRASISTFIQVSLPTEKNLRLRLHEKFGGHEETILHAIHAHMTNCIKNSGPLMSVTENQASRKAEFTQVVEDQLKRGLYVMKRARVQLKDRVDEKGNAVWVEANEIVLDDKGVSVRQEKSPLEEYGLTINQFSITGTNYDKLSEEQFKAKQGSFLAAEKSKAQREAEIQQKLMVVAQGERQAAEETAKANITKAKAVTEGQMRLEVAEKEKLAAETKANQLLSVAKLEKETAEVAAAQAAAVAKIKAEQEKTVAVTAASAIAESLIKKSEGEKAAAAAQSEADRLRAVGIVALAEAKQKEIQLAGKVKEADQVLATIAKDRDVEVAKHLAGINVPSNIIISNGASGQGGTIDPFLFNLNLLKNSGLMDLTPKHPAPTHK